MPSEDRIKFGEHLKYGLQGLSYSQAASALSIDPMLVDTVMKNAAWTGNQDVAGTLKDVMNEPYEGKKGGFWWLLEQFDRPQDMMFSFFDEVMSGNRDLGDIWGRVNRNRTGQEQTGFADILDHVSPGMKRAMSDIAITIASVFPGDQAIEKLGNDPEKAWEEARKVYGFVGDMVIDPLMLAGPASKGLGVAANMVKATKGLSGLGKTLAFASAVADPGALAGKGVKSVGKGIVDWTFKPGNEKYAKMLRTYVMRGTGVKEVDKWLGIAAGQRTAMEWELMGKARRLYKDTLKPSIDKGYDVHLITEDRQGIKRLINDLDLWKKSGVDKGQMLARVDALYTADTMNNPSAMRSAMRKLIDSPDDVNELNRAVSEYRSFIDDLETLRIQYHVPEDEADRYIRDYMQQAKADRDEARRELWDNLISTADEETRKDIARLRNALDSDGELLDDLASSVSMSGGGISKDARQRIIERFSARLPGIMANRAVKDMAKDPVYASLERLTGAATLWRGKVHDPEFRSLLQKIRNLDDAIATAPDYVPHFATATGIAYMNRLRSFFPEGGKMNAFSHQELVRRWRAANGRPLSHEEIEKIIREGNFGDVYFYDEAMQPVQDKELLALWTEGRKRLQAPRSLQDGATVSEVGPLIKQKSLMGRAITAIRENLPGKLHAEQADELANLFDTDVPSILAAYSQETAKSTAIGTYFRGLAEEGGWLKTTEELDALKAEDFHKYAAWVRLDEIGRVGEYEKQTLMSKIVARTPILQDIEPVLDGKSRGGLWVSPDIGNAVANAIMPYVESGSNKAIVKAIDMMKRWWISYTLPLYPAYHTRNAVGNVLNMTHAGMFQDPRYWSSDMMSWLKASEFQRQLTYLDDFQGFKLMKNIKILDGGVERDLYDVWKEAMMLGVIDSGFMSAEVKRMLARETLEEGASKLIPGSMNWAPIKHGRKLGTWIENKDKFALYLSQIARGKTKEEAAAIAKKFLGNFDSLEMTPFERDYLTRVFPFWRWTRFNVPLQFEQMFFNPYARWRMTNLRRIHEEYLEPEGLENGQLPNWASSFLGEVGGAAVNFDKDTGIMRFFGSEGWLPAADIGNIVDSMDDWTSMFRFFAQQSNPIFKVPLELGSGVPWFGDPAPFKGRSQEYFGMDIDARVVSVLRNFRFLNEIDRMDPLSPFVGENSAFRLHKNRELVSVWERALRYLTGATLYTSKPTAEILKYKFDQARKIKMDTARARNAKVGLLGELNTMIQWEEDEAKARGFE